MTNQEHKAILLQGVEVWNQWRKDNPNIVPDLFAVTFRDIDHYDNDLSNADFSYANLRLADFNGANLSSAELLGADLTGARFTNTNLRGADLFAAKLPRARLTDVDLSGANLRAANLSTARLKNVDFSHTHCGLTVFTDVNLSTAKGLDTIHHFRPSVISLETISLSGGKIPEIFLRGCGVAEKLIAALMQDAAQFYPCYISYSLADQDFARHLYDRLQAAGIRCWLDEHPLNPGLSRRATLEDVTRLGDKMILCCSETALTSWWIETELKSIIIKQDLNSEKCFIPLTLGNFVLEQLPPTRVTNTIKMYDNQKFEDWKNNEVFEQAFEQLVNVLRR